VLSLKISLLATHGVSMILMNSFGHSSVGSGLDKSPASALPWGRHIKNQTLLVFGFFLLKILVTVAYSSCLIRSYSNTPY